MASTDAFANYLHTPSSVANPNIEVATRILTSAMHSRQAWSTVCPRLNRIRSTTLRWAAGRWIVSVSERTGASS